jgi:hypothetical protein
MADLDDNTSILISTKGVMSGGVRSPQFFSLVSCGSLEFLVLADGPVSGFHWKPIKQANKHLKGIVKGKPVAVTASGLEIYNPSAKILKTIKKAKAGKNGYVRLNFKKRT